MSNNFSHRTDRRRYSTLQLDWHLDVFFGEPCGRAGLNLKSCCNRSSDLKRFDLGQPARKLQARFVFSFGISGSSLPQKVFFLFLLRKSRSSVQRLWLTRHNSPVLFGSTRGHWPPPTWTTPFFVRIFWLLPTGQTKTWETEREKNNTRTKQNTTRISPTGNKRVRVFEPLDVLTSVVLLLHPDVYSMPPWQLARNREMRSCA